MTILRFSKRVVLGATLVLMVTLIAPTRVLTTYTFMPVGEVQAQEGNGGPMSFLLPLLMMLLLMGAMKNNNLQGEQRDRSQDSLQNLLGLQPNGLNGGQLGPNGGQLLPNGTQVLPNGSLVLPNGGMILPNGGQVLPNGTMVMPNGTQVPNALQLNPNAQPNNLLNLLNLVR